jgi:hypothetical protein
MSFEQNLRDRLREEAGALPLPDRDPEQAVGRASARRRHRRMAAAGLAVAVAAGVAVPRVVDEDGRHPMSVGPASESGLAPTGPLDLDWRRADGGLSDVRGAFQGGEVVYALSTGPGVRTEDYPDGDYPRSLYRLGDDGTWEPVPLESGRPRASDIAGAGGLVYSVSTGPASEGGEAVAHLSTSGDGGASWDSQDVPLPDPPSTTVDWEPVSSVAVENTGSTTLAIVTTRFRPPVETLFPEMAGPEETGVGYAVETRDEGLVLVRYRTASEGADATSPSANIEEAEAREAQAAADAGEEEDSDEEDIRTITWSQLGVDGPGDLATRYQLFTARGDAWELVAAQPEAFANIDWITLASAGDRFVVTGWSEAEAGSTVLTSPDGASWSPVATGPYEQIVGLGPVLVRLPSDGVTLGVSDDAGASWSEVDLGEVAGVDGGSRISTVDTGPLGLALVVDGGADGLPDDLVVSGDLADWTTTPLADVVGFEDIGTATPVVGEDRIVVTASHPVDDDSSEPPASVTAVGTPVRTP